MTEDEARRYALTRKREGATYLEIVAELNERGAINPRTHRPYARHSVTLWVRGASEDGYTINDQRGRRHTHLMGMTVEQRATHDAEMHERKLERARQWRRENREYLREWARSYYRDW